MNTITYRQANKLLTYEPATGQFFWKIDRGQSIKAGNQAGYKRVNNHRYITINRIEYKLSKIALLLCRQGWVDQVYHLDGEKGNLMKANLTTDNPNKKVKAVKVKKESLTFSNITNRRSKEPVKKSHGSHPTSIQPFLKESLVTVVNPNQNTETKVIKTTLTRVNGKKRLSQKNDAVCEILAYCPKCLKSYYAKRINYTQTIPAPILCKSCKRAKTFYNFNKSIDNTINKIIYKKS